MDAATFTDTAGTLVTTTKNGGNTVMRWLQRRSGVTYTLKQNSTLASDSWITAFPQIPALDGDQTCAPTDYDYHKVTVPPGGGKLFFRVEGMEN